METHVIQVRQQLPEVDEAFRVEFNPDAIAKRTDALEKSALIGMVTCAEQQDAAVAAQTDLHTLRQIAEKQRKDLKQPHLDVNRKIDAASKEFCGPIDEELIRIAGLIGDFQQLEQARARAAVKLQQENLSHLEEDRAAELAQAKSHDDLDAINEKYAEKTALLSTPVTAPARATGQVVKSDWDIQVTDIWALVRAHPLCVKVEPRLNEIKNLLDAGLTVAGVTAKRIQKSSVRSKREQTAIDI
jgi:hypothetical protein